MYNHHSVCSLEIVGTNIVHNVQNVSSQKKWLALEFQPNVLLEFYMARREATSIRINVCKPHRSDGKGTKDNICMGGYCEERTEGKRFGPDETFGGYWVNSIKVGLGPPTVLSRRLYYCDKDDTLNAFQDGFSHGGNFRIAQHENAAAWFDD